MDIPIPISNFFCTPSRILKIPINDPVDKFNYTFLIPFLAHVPILGFS